MATGEADVLGVNVIRFHCAEPASTGKAYLTPGSISV
jgi:hypothetical protein